MQSNTITTVKFWANAPLHYKTELGTGLMLYTRKFYNTTVRSIKALIANEYHSTVITSITNQRKAIAHNTLIN